MDNDETDQFEIVEPLDLVGEQAPRGPAQEAVQIALGLDLHDGGDGLVEQFRVVAHLAAVAGEAVEFPAERRIGFAVALAQAAKPVEQLFGGEVVDDDGTRFRNIDQIERMEAVLAVDIDRVVAVFRT